MLNTGKIEGGEIESAVSPKSQKIRDVLILKKT